MFVSGALLYLSSPKQIKMCMFEIMFDARIWFQMAVMGNAASGCLAQTIESGHTFVMS